jgi:hypothetical protein
MKPDITRMERNMIAESLRFKASAIRRDAGSRKWSGPDWKSMRADLRGNARLYENLADRVYEEEE